MRVHASRHMPDMHVLSQLSTICLHVHVPAGPGAFCGGGFDTHATTIAITTHHRTPRR
jgi:hypothetical protein